MIVGTKPDDCKNKAGLLYDHAVVIDYQLVFKYPFVLYGEGRLFRRAYIYLDISRLLRLSRP